MFTQPDDLAETTIRDALRTGWGFVAVSLEYVALGFGSHHWLAIDADGTRRFVTVDDLSAKLRSAHDSIGHAYARLEDAFITALFLSEGAGLSFVVAPLPAGDGRVVHRLDEHYSLAVHPFVVGTHVGADGEFTTDADRRAVLDLLIRLHGAPPSVTRVDDFLVPHRDELELMCDELDVRWDSGPYAGRAHDLLVANVSGIRTLLAAYDVLAARVSSRPERMVVTHGEPNSRNVMLTSAGFVLVDWDTALLAPPERDLCDLCRDEPALLDAYTAATGVEVDPRAMALYRLWFDLAEIGLYLSLFRAPHTETRDIAESWAGLRYFLRPADRWPQLFTGDGSM